MSEDLLACPFCGGEPERFTIEEPGDNFGGDVISCTRCGASSHVEFGRKENLVSIWNTRAADTERAAIVAWLRSLQVDDATTAYPENLATAIEQATHLRTQSI